MARHLDFSAEQIGYISALMLGTKVIGPYWWGWLADVSGRSMAIIRAGLLLACLCFSALIFTDTFWTMVLVVAVYSFFWHAVLSQFEVVTLSYLKAMPERYTQVRVWGSIGFIAAVAGLGMLFDHVDIGHFPLMLFLMLAVLWLSSLWVKEPPSAMQNKPKERLGAFWQQIKQPAMLAFFFCCFLMQLSHGPYYTFYTIYLESVAYTRTQIGLLWSLGVLAEVVLFMVMPQILSRFSLRGLFLTTFALTLLRWLLIAWFAQYAVVVIFAQLFHAASFGSFHAVAVEIVRRKFYQGSSGQGQAIYSVVFGAGGAAGALLSGWLWPLGSQYLFSFAAACALLALAILWRWLKLNESAKS